MIQAGQRVRIRGGRSVHIARDTRTSTADARTLCAKVAWLCDDLSPDPTLPLCATCDQCIMSEP